MTQLTGEYWQQVESKPNLNLLKIIKWTDEPLKKWTSFEFKVLTVNLGENSDDEWNINFVFELISVFMTWKWIQTIFVIQI